MKALPDKLQRAVNSLLFNHCFFAAVLLRQNLKADNTCKTFYVDGQNLGFNPEFLNGLSHDEVVAVLAHEVLHLTSLHHARAHGRDQKRWNKACDYAINPILQTAGFRLPEGALIDPAFTGKSAEEIYRLIPADSNPDKGKNQQDQSNGGNEQENGQGDDSGDSFGEVRPSSQPGEIAEETAKIQTAQAMSQAKAAGQMPGGIDRAIKDVPPRTDWKEILARFVSEQAQIDSSWTRPNRRFTSQGIILPSLAGQTYGELVFVADTSGSIRPDDVALVASEMLSALSQMEMDGKTPEVTAIYCDSQIQGIETLTPFTKPNPKGGGGTDFRPPFEHVENEGMQPRGLVYFTDGYCDSFPVAPSYPVLWLVIGNYTGFRPPFGEVCFADMG